MDWCPWLKQCLESTSKGGSAFVQVCLGFNLAHAGWRAYRQQCKELFKKQIADSADTTADLLDSRPKQNVLTKWLITAYVWGMHLFDLLQKGLLWLTYSGAVAGVLISLWMLFFDKYTKHGWILLLPPVFIPLFFLVSRWIIQAIAFLVFRLLRLPSASKLAEQQILKPGHEPGESDSSD